MRNRRTLVVLIDEIAIGDGDIPPPQINAVIKFPLRFIELPPSDGHVVTINAVLEPSDRDPIWQYTGANTPRRWQWEGLLRGDGWTASWRGFRPLTGRVEITGRFYGVMGYDTSGRARGRVTRVQLVTERFRRATRTSAWLLVPGHRTLRDVQEAPRFFDLFSMGEDDVKEVDRGVGALVDLDLDDVPALPARPRIVPGDVSASGDILWGVDQELPLVASIDGRHIATEHILPGPIGSPRRVWATPSGCWVGGSDGTYWCSPGEAPRQVSKDPVHAGAVAGEAFLACAPGGTWWLHSGGCGPTAVNVPDCVVRSVAVAEGGFLAFVSQRPREAGAMHYLLRVSITGEVTVGPELRNFSWRGGRPYLAGEPLRMFQGDTVAEVLPDLTIGQVQRLGGKQFTAGQVGEFIWTVGHPPNGTGDSGWWPLPGPTTYDRTEQFWLFTLLDATTLEPVRSTPIFSTNPNVTIDGSGTVWIIARGVQQIPTESMQWPIRLDVAELLGQASG
ncbi:hypothetical protein [Lolliginicoccus suaedae]|uniref:hypothetical protein n=1 Tax=Lolliginicoccus suaedae TaxID=2605429 RepID=UPI0011F065AA|nr:hypothetical protein [Lolliginicoccus suaedae]